MQSVELSHPGNRTGGISGRCGNHEHLLTRSGLVEHMQIRPARECMDIKITPSVIHFY